MFFDTNLKNHLENSTTVETRSTILAEWNMNVPDNIFKLGNYRNRDTAIGKASLSFDANDVKSAKADLQWIVDHGHTDEFKAIARIRLAGLLLDEKAYDEGLKILSAEFPVQFAALVADRRGDLLFAQNKLDEARKEFKTALEKTEIKNPARQLIQLKLDALGGNAKSAG